MDASEIEVDQQPIKISIIEDDPMTVIALEMVFDDDRRFSIVSISNTVADGLVDIKDFEPDVILLDLGLPDGTGLDVAEQIEDASIVVFTANAEEQEVKDAFSLGASGYCLKGGEPEQIKTAVITVHQGNIYLDTKIAQAVIAQPGDDGTEILSCWTCPSGEVLREREIEILQLIADGQSNAEIAENLGFSVHTVKSYLREIMIKMSAKNRAELAAMSIRFGIIQ